MLHDVSPLIRRTVNLPTGNSRIRWAFIKDNMAAELSGLLSDSVDLLLYEWACDSTKPEYSTSRFWMRVIQKQFPVGDGYVLIPEVPPIEGTGKRIDMGVFAIYDKDMHPLLFVEWKRAAKDSPGGRSAAEKQVLGYCQQYLEANPGQPFMHAMVCAGALATIWKVVQDDPTFDGARTESHAYTDAKTGLPNVLSQGFEEVQRTKPVSRPGPPPYIVTSI